ncbi:MAG: PAS domain S-box protein [Leptolyngbyaceae cyanobacterium SL_1_1]|nr:PAS domain S-box protein [Leptolyngbyaceae cyanobacterium SL_1_1]
MSISVDFLYQLEPGCQSAVIAPSLISLEATVAEAIALMTPTDATLPTSPLCLLVTAGDRLVGLFTEQNLVYCARADVSFAEALVQQWMTPNPPVLPIAQLNNLNQLRTLLLQTLYLPIVDAYSRPLGLVSTASLLRALPLRSGKCGLAPKSQASAAALNQYAQIVFEAIDRICLVDRKGVYKIANRAYLTWKEQTAETLIGTAISKVVGVEHFNRVIKPRLARCCGGETIHYEEWVTIGIHPEFVSITYAPYVEADGEISAAIVTVRDISQLKRAERAEDQLRQREAFLRNIFDSAAEVIWVAERLEDDEYWIVSANRAVESILGISTLDWIGRRLEELWAPETAQIMRSRYQACLEQDQPVTWQGPIATATGSKWMLTTLSRLDDCHGKPRVLGISLDIGDRRQAEEALRLAEARHRTTLEALPDLMIRMQADGTYLAIKPASEMLMLPISVGDSLRDILPENLARHRLQLTERALQTQEIQVYEFDLVIEHKTCWQEVRIVPLEADEVLVIVRDVTDRHSAELARQKALQELQQLNQELERRVAQRTAELRKSEQQFRAIFEQAAVGIVQADRSGRLIRVNQRFCQLTGYGESELLQKSYWEFTPAEYHNLDTECMQRLFAGEVDSVTLEKQYIRKDSSLQWVNLTVSLLRDSSGQPLCDMVVVEDISDRKRSEQALEESQQQLNSIADNIPGNIFREIFHPDGRITLSFMSQGEKELSGLSPEAIKHDRSLLLSTIHPTDREQFERRLLASAQALQPFDYEYRVIHTSGEIRWARESIRYFRLDNGDIVGDGITLDITQQKQAEAKMHHALAREKELNQLKSRFISMASHEFRTPMSVIASSAGILQEFSDKLSEEKRQQHLQTIQTYIKHTTRLLDDILLMNRVEAGKLTFRPDILRLIEFCRSLTRELQPSMPHHRLNFKAYCHQRSHLHLLKSGSELTANCYGIFFAT